MEENNNQRQPKVKVNAPVLKETWYFSTLTHLTILFLVLTGIALNIYIPNGPQTYEPPHRYFTRTNIPHVERKYSKWKLSDSFLQELWVSMNKSPVNAQTGRHELMFTVVNKGHVELCENWFCSLKSTNPKENSFVIIALDEESYRYLKSSKAPVLLLQSNNTKKSVNHLDIDDYFESVNIRNTILHQLLMWNCETVVSDVDVIFFSNPFKLFKGDAEFEMECDSKNVVDYQPFKKNSPQFMFNTGFYKVQPTEGVISLMKEWLTKTYSTPKLSDQKALVDILADQNSASNFEFGVLSEHKKYGMLRVRVIDPMLAVNAGGVYKEGKAAFKKEAAKRNIKTPVLCHFSHVGSSLDKKSMMKTNNQWFVKVGKCSEPSEGTFSVWDA